MVASKCAMSWSSCFVAIGLLVSMFVNSASSQEEYNPPKEFLAGAERSYEELIEIHKNIERFLNKEAQRTGALSSLLSPSQANDPIVPWHRPGLTDLQSTASNKPVEIWKAIAAFAKKVIDRAAEMDNVLKQEMSIELESEAVNPYKVAQLRYDHLIVSIAEFEKDDTEVPYKDEYHIAYLPKICLEIVENLYWFLAEYKFCIEVGYRYKDMNWLGPSHSGAREIHSMKVDNEFVKRCHAKLNRFVPFYASTDHELYSYLLITDIFFWLSFARIDCQTLIYFDKHDYFKSDAAKHKKAKLFADDAFYDLKKSLDKLEKMKQDIMLKRQVKRRFKPVQLSPSQPSKSSSQQSKSSLQQSKSEGCFKTIWPCSKWWLLVPGTIPVLMSAYNWRYEIGHWLPAWLPWWRKPAASNVSSSTLEIVSDSVTQSDFDPTLLIVVVVVVLLILIIAGGVALYLWNVGSSSKSLPKSKKKKEEDVEASASGAAGSSDQAASTAASSTTETSKTARSTSNK